MNWFRIGRSKWKLSKLEWRWHILSKQHVEWTAVPQVLSFWCMFHQKNPRSAAESESWTGFSESRLVGNVTIPPSLTECSPGNSSHTRFQSLCRCDMITYVDVVRPWMRSHHGPPYPSSSPCKAPWLSKCSFDLLGKLQCDGTLYITSHHSVIQHCFLKTEMLEEIMSAAGGFVPLGGYSTSVFGVEWVKLANCLFNFIQTWWMVQWWLL